MLRGLRVELNLNAECNNASKQPLGRYDFACVKRRAGAFTMWPGRFLKKMSDFLAPWGDTKKRTQIPLTHTQQQQLWLVLILGTGDTVVAGPGIADGSRAK